MRWSKRQRGAMALGTVLLLLVLISWIVVAAVRVASGDQRSLGNELSQRNSMALAEAGRARALAYLSRHAVVVRSENAGGWMNPGGAHWAACTPADLELPCGDGVRNRYGADWSAYRNLSAAADENESGTVRVHLIARGANLIAGSSQPLVIGIVSEGASIDGAAHAQVYQDLLIYPLIATAPEATVMAAQARIGGDGSLIANQDGFAPGVPLTLWTAADAVLADTARSCMPSAATIEGCPAAGMSNAATEAADVLDVDGNKGNLPDSPVAVGDVLERIFGLASPQRRLLRSQARPVDCGATPELAPSAIGWSIGNCVLPPDRVLGSASAPVVLIVENGDFRASGGSLHGIVLLLSSDAKPRTASLQNGFRLIGALLANTELRVEGERYQLRYDSAVLRLLTQTQNAPLAVASVPGSWRDYP